MIKYISAIVAYIGFLGVAKAGGKPSSRDAGMGQRTVAVEKKDLEKKIGLVN
jgi:hypothetical protein